MSKLVTNLTNETDIKSEFLKEIETKYNETSFSLANLMTQKAELQRQYEEELRKMQETASTQLKNIFSEHENLLAYLEAQKKELMEREAELEKREAELENREALNKKERQKLDHQKEMNARAAMEEKRVNEKLLKLAEDSKMENKKLQMQIIKMEKKIDAKQTLESEIEHLRGAVRVQEHIRRGHDGFVESRERLLAIQDKLKAIEEELESREAMDRVLMVKEFETNREVGGARKEMIRGLKEKTCGSGGVIGVKRMGDIDIVPFRKAVKKRRLPGAEAEVKAMELCSQWQEELKNPVWYTSPFKGTLDSNYKKLRMLKNQLGNEAYEAVSTAMEDMNEYNPHGRCAVPEMWNFKHNRKATLKEAISYLLDQWKRLEGENVHQSCFANQIPPTLPIERRHGKS